MAVVVFLVVAKSSGIQVATECSTLWSVLKFLLMQTSKIFVLWNLPLWASHTLDGFEDVSLAPLSSLTDKGAQSLEGNCGQGRKVALLLCPARSACSTSAKVQACAQKKTEERKDKETKIGRGPANSFVKVLVVTSCKMTWKLLARMGFEAMKQFLTICSGKSCRKSCINLYCKLKQTENANRKPISLHTLEDLWTSYKASAAAQHHEARGWGMQNRAFRTGIAQVRDSAENAMFHPCELFSPEMDRRETSAESG